MADLLATFGVPLTIGGATALLTQSVIVAAVILIVDKLIAYEMNVKNAFIMALGAYFLTPLTMLGIAAAGLELPSLVVQYIVPMLVWIVLGELLLQSVMAVKAKVAVVSFIIYTALQMAGIVALIFGYLPF